MHDVSQCYGNGSGTTSITVWEGRQRKWGEAEKVGGVGEWEGRSEGGRERREGEWKGRREGG